MAIEEVDTGEEEQGDHMQGDVLRSPCGYWRWFCVLTRMGRMWVLLGPGYFS